jgi:hypothetical protein
MGGIRTKFVDCTRVGLHVLRSGRRLLFKDNESGMMRGSATHF